MSNVYRAYIPTVTWQKTQILAVADNALAQNICQVNVDRLCVHRKVWAYLHSSSTTQSMDYDLVAILNGVEVYRQKLAQWNGASTPGWMSGVFAVSTNIGAVNEQIFSYAGGVILIAIACWRLNISCDSFHLQVNSHSTVGTWDAGVFVQSQKGI